MKMSAKTTGVGVALLLLMFTGIAGSIWAGGELNQTARNVWLNQFRTDAARLSDVVFFWTSKTKVNLRAIASQLKAQGTSDQDTFLDLIDEAGAWDPDVVFDSVAFAQRVMRQERESFEAQNRTVIMDALRRGEAAEPVFESYVVTMTSVGDGLLKRMNDLTTHPAMNTAVFTAFRLPGDVILGPSYVGEGGHRKVLVATASSNSIGEGVMVAEIDITEFFSVFTADHLRKGLRLRLIERDSEAQAENVFFPIIGEMTPDRDVISTEVIRLISGQARWDLNWDVTSEYLGGPESFAAALVQIGGSILSILIFGSIGYLAFQNIRFNAQVAEQTASLSQNSMIVQLTMDSIDQGFAVWNADQRLVVWSRCCYDFWLEPPESVLRVGMHMRDLLSHLVSAGAFGDDPGPETVDKELRRISAAGQASEDRFVSPQGRHVHVRRFPLERGGYVAVYTDITAQEEATKSLEESRQNSEMANQAKSEFLSSMSHELRTPMNAILGFAQLLELNPSDPLTKGQKEQVGHILKSGNHLLELIDRVLDLSKIEAGKLEVSVKEIVLNDVCRECLLMTKTNSTDRDLTVDSNLKARKTIEADYTRFKQVLLNLLSNAIKYNVKGGRVTLTSEDTHNNMVRISVTDTGPGIAEDDQINLFTPFNRLGKESSDIEGTGVGLAISKQLVEAMGGRIGVESKVGTGSAFWVEFPAVESTIVNAVEDTQHPVTNEDIEQTSTPASILYVEDNPANTQLMQAIIEKIDGVTLLSASNAARGILMAEEQQPSLILMDINLPDMDGIEAKKLLSSQDKTRDIPVIALTAAAMKSDIEKGNAAGFRAYLTKPFNVTEIMNTIKTELRKND